MTLQSTQQEIVQWIEQEFRVLQQEMNEEDWQVTIAHIATTIADDYPMLYRKIVHFGEEVIHHALKQFVDSQVCSMEVCYLATPSE